MFFLLEERIKLKGPTRAAFVFVCVFVCFLLSRSWQGRKQPIYAGSQPSWSHICHFYLCQLDLPPDSTSAILANHGQLHSCPAPQSRPLPPHPSSSQCFCHISMGRAQCSSKPTCGVPKTAPRPCYWDSHDSAYSCVHDYDFLQQGTGKSARGKGTWGESRRKPEACCQGHAADYWSQSACSKEL